MTFRSLIESSAVSLLAVASLSAQSAVTPAAAPAAVSKAGAIPRAADGHPDLTGIWFNATRTPLERPAAFAGKATLSDAEAREWEAKENARWGEGSTIEGGRPVSIQGGACNVLFYDNGSGLARFDGQKRTSMVVDPPDGHVLVQTHREEYTESSSGRPSMGYRVGAHKRRCTGNREWPHTGEGTPSQPSRSAGLTLNPRRQQIPFWEVAT